MIRQLAVGITAALACAVAFGCSDDDSDEIGVTLTPPPQTSDASTTPSLEGTPQALETTTIAFVTGGEEIELEVQVADEPAERSTGLMWVQSMPEDEGMLFVWPQNSNSGFWMQNTYIPLTVAFVREDGEILHIEDMEPLTQDLHTPDESYRYAVEVNQGWFAENGIDVGDTVEGLP